MRQKQEADAFALAVGQLDNELPLTWQLYQALQQAVLQRRLPPGLRLPSTRDMAQLLGVSRNTVMNGVGQLVAEGYLETVPKSGTYVARRLPEEMLHVAEKEARLREQRVGERNKRPLSPQGQQLRDTQEVFGKTAVSYPTFVTGIPDLAAFPFDLWGRLVSKQYRQGKRELFGEVGHGSAGYLPLRQAIATYLQTARGVRCQPEQVLIVNGSQQGLYLAAHTLLEPGAQVWIEEPGYLGARAALGSTGATLMPVPVTAEGIDVAQGAVLAPAARCAYVTPSHQYPLGSTMSLANRIALLNWAEESGAWIIEDDYDSEYRYSGQPLPSLQGLDQNGRVIYVGTFSKVMFPSLRLGYLVVPPDLVAPLARLRALVDSHTPTAVQGAMAEFIVEGHFVRHIRRMRQLYGARRAYFAEAAARELGDWLHLNETEAGMHVVGWLPSGVDDRAVVLAAQRQQVTVKSLSSHYLGDCPRPGLVLGVMGVAETAVSPALIRLRKAIESASYKAGKRMYNRSV